MNKSKNKIKNSAGVTLIELLIVIAIISILAISVVVAVAQIRMSNRDRIRKADLEKLAGALEQYYSENAVYAPDLCDLLNNCATGANPAESGTYVGGLGSREYYTSDYGAWSGAPPTSWADEGLFNYLAYSGEISSAYPNKFIMTKNPALPAVPYLGNIPSDPVGGNNWWENYEYRIYNKGYYIRVGMEKNSERITSTDDPGSTPLVDPDPDPAEFMTRAKLWFSGPKVYQDTTGSGKKIFHIGNSHF